jgi:hypothetical protein
MPGMRLLILSSEGLGERTTMLRRILPLRGSPDISAAADRILSGLWDSASESIMARVLLVQSRG